MGVRILHDSEQGYAALYCSTSDVAFGPIFNEGDASFDYKAADERAQAFLKWCDVAPKWNSYEKVADMGRRDPRELTDAGIQAAYSDWRAQERDQYEREDAAERQQWAANSRTISHEAIHR